MASTTLRCVSSLSASSSSSGALPGALSGALSGAHTRSTNSRIAVVSPALEDNDIYEMYSQCYPSMLNRLIRSRPQGELEYQRYILIQKEREQSIFVSAQQRWYNNDWADLPPIEPIGPYNPITEKATLPGAPIGAPYSYPPPMSSFDTQREVEQFEL